MKNDFESSAMEGFIWKLKSDNNASIQVISGSRFEPSKGIPSFPNDKKYYWLKIPIHSQSNKQLVLEYQQIFIDEITFYIFKNDSLIKTSSSTWQLNFSDKTFPSRYHAISFDVEKNQTYSIFIRCHNSKINFSNRAFLRLFAKNIYEQETDYYFIQVSSCVGGLLLVAILSAVFFVYSRKNIYVYYAFYLISISIYFLVINGIINQFFSPKSSFLAKPEFGSWLVILNLAFHILYVYEFLKIKQSKPRWLNFAFLAFIVLCIIQLFLVGILSQSPISFSVFYYSFTFLIVSAIVLSISTKQKEAYLYLLASGPVFLTFLLVTLGVLGFIKINAIFFYYAHIPIALEGLGLGVALLHQFNKERHEIQTELENNRLESTRKILLAQEEERQRLALDLHDDLGGSLSVLNRELDEFNEKNANILTKSVSLTQKIVNDLRTISHHLMPSSFQEKGLKKVVDESIEMINRQSKTQFLFICEGEEKTLNLDTEINIYRIIKELMANVLKHADAQQAIIQMIYFDTFLFVSIEDNGKGFDHSAQEHWGIGFKNINLRSQYLKASLAIESSAKGTLISLEIPYNASENKNTLG